jgi:hypothetical protein
MAGWFTVFFCRKLFFKIGMDSLANYLLFAKNFDCKNYTPAFMVGFFVEQMTSLP